MGVGMAKKIIPFSWYPYSWGLAGKTREIAKAEYELTGYELEKQLLRIKQDELEEQDFLKKNAALDLKHKKLTQSEYDRFMLSFITDEKKRDIAFLTLDYEEGKIKEIDYSKQLATLNDQPWVTVLNMDFTKGSSLEGSFELDWNEAFVKKLESEGYKGPSPDIVVNQWFMEICRNVAMEEFDGTGDFTADSEANLETYKRWSEDTKSYPKGRKGYK